MVRGTDFPEPAEGGEGEGGDVIQRGLSVRAQRRCLAPTAWRGRLGKRPGMLAACPEEGARLGRFLESSAPCLGKGRPALGLGIPAWQGRPAAGKGGSLAKSRLLSRGGEGRGGGTVRSAALSGPDAHQPVLSALLAPLPFQEILPLSGRLWRLCSPGEFPATG